LRPCGRRLPAAIRRTRTGRSCRGVTSDAGTCDRPARPRRVAHSRRPRRVTAVDWAGCLRRWSKDYEFTTSNRVTSFVAPRGLSDITAKLAEVKWRYAATGSIAAQALSPIAPLRQAMLYVDDIDSARRALDAREADEGANLLIAEPFDEVVYERTTTVNGLSIVAPSQAAADLLTGSGRMPSEGEELLDWMKANERVWRR